MTKHPKTLSALKSSLLAEFEERLADYHIRGCKLLDESTAKMCERHRKKTEEFFSHALSTVAEKTAEEIFEWFEWQRPTSQSTDETKLTEEQKKTYHLLSTFMVELYLVGRKRWLRREK